METRETKNLSNKIDSNNGSSDDLELIEIYRLAKKNPKKMKAILELARKNKEFFEMEDNEMVRVLKEFLREKELEEN